VHILFDAARRVNPARPFAAGLAGSGRTPRPRDLEVGSMLRSLNYPPCNVTDAVAWVGSRGRADGCPVVDAEDVAAVNAVVARHRADAAADEATGGDIPCDPALWPAWTDFHHFEPSPEDRTAWAAESERLESERADRAADARAAESAAVDALTAGLIPRDLADDIARTSLVGHDA